MEKTFHVTLTSYTMAKHISTVLDTGLDIAVDVYIAESILIGLRLGTAMTCTLQTLQ